MHTEEEAREKWCPHAMEIGTDGTSAGNRYNGVPDTSCIGSACMAWRCAEDRIEEQTGKFKAVKRSDGRFYREPADTIRAPTGYCGLSGSPSPSMGVK